MRRNHPNRNWRKRWAVDSAQRIVRHESGLAIQMRPDATPGRWVGVLAEELPKGYPMDPQALRRLITEATRIWQERGHGEATVKLPMPVIVPEDEPWPVQGRDPETGDLILAEGFLNRVEDASGMPRDSITEEMVCELLIGWYLARLDEGYPPDPTMESLRREAGLESRH